MAAHGREQSVRMTLESDAATVGVLPEVRAVVLAYQALVKQYPASGYADDALWQAGRLSVDAFLRFGQARDRAAGTRLLKALVAGYPTSKPVKRVLIEPGLLSPVSTRIARTTSLARRAIPSSSTITVP